MIPPDLWTEASSREPSPRPPPLRQRVLVTTPVPHHRVDGAGGPALILGPSLGTSTHVWDAQIPALARDFRVIRWDFPGHGGTPAPDDGTANPAAFTLTVADLAARVLALADALHIDRFAYAGISLGGAVGAWLAIHHPDRVASLALVCTSAHFGDDPTPWHERAARVRENGTGPLADTIAKRWFTPAFAASPAAQRLVGGLRDVDPIGYAACCDAIAAYNVRADLPRITAPTLVIAGRDDPATPPAHARELTDAVADSALAEIPHASHIANVEQPTRIGDLLRDHFRATADKAPTDDHTVTDAERRTRGTAVRRAVLGDAHVDRATTNTTEFTAPFQDFITRYAWGEIWTRPGLDRRTRSCITLTALVAHGHLDELAMHVRAAIRNGLTADEIQEVLLQSAVYCGVPAANSAFAVANRVLAELGDPELAYPAAESTTSNTPTTPDPAQEGPLQ
ncbi:MAG: 3-oxoadipate enol-lactonase [Streptomycetaceae bacterium]|nr:3-oxoadipate enol-lactonase [Streptomycetaceae bacterium]